MCVILCAFAWGVYRKISLDKDSSELAIGLLRSSLSAGSAEHLIPFAHPDWLQLMPGDSINGYIENSVKTLGPLQAMTSITGESSASMVSLPGSNVAANYTIEMQMGTSPITADIEMLYEDKQWWLLNVVLNADQLMD